LTPYTNLDDNKTLKAFRQLLVIVSELREKCPWDQKQTMESLRHLTIEETFELSEAILEGDMEDVKKELGDLLLHIVLYALIASEQRSFTITQIIQTLCDKLIHRHPHIYSQEKAEDIQTVKKNWERLKLEEKGTQSVLGGVPQALPSLIKAMRIQEKTHAIGFDLQSSKAIWEKIEKDMQVLMQQHNQDIPTPIKQEKVLETFGALLFSLVSYARLMEVNPEEALEKANKKFVKEFQHIEQHVTNQGKQIAQLSNTELMRYWNEAKQQLWHCIKITLHGLAYLCKGTNTKPGYLLMLYCVADVLCTCQMASPIGITKVPPTFNCVISSSGNCLVLAETSILSNGAFLFNPNFPSACTISALLKGYFFRLLLPQITNAGTISTPYTAPVAPTIWASNTVVHPEPEPMSSTFSPCFGANVSNIKATVVGCEIVTS
jgi:tetrapyrrole methylase family protein/MazG family protein